MKGIRFLVAAIVLVVFCIATLVKCTTDKSEEQVSGGNVYYSFDWSKAQPGQKLPTKVRYCFYPMDGGSAIQMDDEADGLNFTLPPARYQLLIFNCDAENLDFRNTNKYETAEAFIPVTKAGNDGQLGGTTPLYGVAVGELEIKTGENSPLKFSPQPLTRSVSINIKVSGMDQVAECKGKLTNMAASLNLSKQAVVTDDLKDIDFKAKPSAEGVSASILMLGKPVEKGEEPPVTSQSHEMQLDFTMHDGSIASSTIDLGNSIEQTEGNDVGVDVEATVVPGPTFTVVINHWEVAAGDNLVIE